MGGMDTEMERDLISIMKEKQTISRKNKKSSDAATASGDETVEYKPKKR